MRMLGRLVLVSVASAAIGFGAAQFVSIGQQPAPSATPAAPSVARVPDLRSVAPAVTPPQVPRAVPASRAEVQLSFASVVRKVSASVVNVYATTVRQASSPFAGDPFFEQFFGGGGQLSRPQTSQSLGSGVVVDTSGIVITNSHVVNGATDIRISLADGHEYAVDVALDDPPTDLAVLRIRDPGEETFEAVEFGDSDGLEVGDLVLAIGNPFGVGQTVTSGIVSALARTGVESSNYEFFIQTDAAINPGNSGGALVDLDGRLVGINTAIFSRSGGSVGIGFAIPANMARVIAQAGIAGGELVRPWLGARLQNLTADIAAGLGLDVPQGALIAEVAPDGPAERAGLRSGDVVVGVNGFAVQQPSALDFRLATLAVGARAEIDYVRNGQRASVSIVLEGAPQPARAVVSGNTRFAGATVETLTPAGAQELGLSYDARGVLVRSVERGSPAEELGLEAGDIILSLNGQATDDAEAFARIANDRPRGWQVVMQRGGRVFQAVVSG